MNERNSQPQREVMEQAELRSELEQHHAAGYGWALSCCARAPELAQDVLQIAYLKVLQNRARYDGRASFKTWLFAVIRRTAADEMRREWFRQLRLRGWHWEQPTSVQLPDRGDRLDASARLAAFQQALTRLAKRQREIMHLVFYQELSLQEASKVMGVSVGSARTHYERGKRNLRLWLEESGQFNEYRKNREQTETTL